MRTLIVMISPRSNTVLRTLVLLAVALHCGPASAHLNSTGMGPLYDGLAHFLMSPEDLVPALALALLAGLRGADYGRRALATLPLAWLVGALAGTTAAVTDAGPWWSGFWLLVTGGLVVEDAKVSLRALTFLAAVFGLLHGYLNGSGMGTSAYAVLAALGVASAVFFVAALVAAFAVRLQAHWARIAVRVGGSWVAASGVLMLGWWMGGA